MQVFFFYPSMAGHQHRPAGLQALPIMDNKLLSEPASAVDGQFNRPFFFDCRWPVFYLDNHLLAVYKPGGLLVQGDMSGDVCLLSLGKQWLKDRFHKPGKVFLGMVHRLDRPVAGVVLFARTSKAAARLSRQFRERTVAKQYLAVVDGAMPKASGRLRHHIERIHRKSRVVSEATPNSQEARLRYRVLDRDGQRSLVQVHLETGRRHQIRIQLAHAGCPIVGDLRYGAAAALPGRQIALLAHHLDVEHPTRAERVKLTCPRPQGWPWPDEEAGKEVPPPWDWRAFDCISNRVFGKPPACPYTSL